MTYNFKNNFKAPSLNDAKETECFLLVLHFLRQSCLSQDELELVTFLLQLPVYFHCKIVPVT